MKQIFINLPVNDLEKSMQFYKQIGFCNEPLFTGQHQICMAWSNQIFVMLQSKDFFGAGNQKPLADTQHSIGASYTLPVESIEKLHEIMDRGLLAGGKEPAPLLDEGFMQLRTIEDIDGHTWGVICLDIEKFKAMKLQE